MNEKVVLEAYMMVREASVVTPSVKEIKRKIIYNIDAKCYDLIYNLTPDMVQESEIAKILMLHEFMFTYEGRLWNRTQNVLFEEF